MKQIILGVFIALIIAFSSLYIFQSWSHSYVDIFRIEEQFFTKQFDPHEKKIFLLGSSEMGMLNATYINENVAKVRPEYIVYNLAVASDTPSQRLQLIDKIISLKPQIVIYGIGYRDFANMNSLIKTGIDKPPSPLPDPYQLFHLSSIGIALNDLLNLQSPKFVTEEVLNTLLNSFGDSNAQSSELVSMNYTPLYSHFKEVEFISNTSELESKYEKNPPNLGFFDSLDSNDEMIALEKIIDKLHKNNIKVIIFTNPHAKIFFENLSTHNKEVYDTILKQISEKYNVKIYSLDDKYQNLNIWYDYYHVAINQKSLIFSNDIAKLILEEIQ